MQFSVLRRVFHLSGYVLVDSLGLQMKLLNGATSSSGLAVSRDTLRIFISSVYRILVGSIKT
jgi:uncharacterized protein YhhL (DUF1145 family)